MITYVFIIMATIGTQVSFTHMSQGTSLERCGELVAAHINNGRDPDYFPFCVPSSVAADLRKLHMTGAFIN